MDLKNYWIFETDGSGNMYDGVPVTPTGNYTIFLQNTGEKWKQEELFITSNQAELKGIMSAMMISISRSYENVIIKTDSKNAVNWLNETWKARNYNVKPLVNYLLKLKSMIKNLRIEYIPRGENSAHGI